MRWFGELEETQILSAASRASLVSCIRQVVILSERCASRRIPRGILLPRDLLRFRRRKIHDVRKIAAREISSLAVS
jgi:hypothetical protein